VFAGYTILRMLGAGGMGEVYQVKHPRLPRTEALKVLAASLTADPNFRARFTREADLAAALWHPHIVSVHDRGEYEGRLWISMDYVEGTDARRLLDERYPRGMPPDLVVEITTAVADALDYAHQRGLLHRDVKPGNILLADAEGRRRIVLADFGVARHMGEISGLTATNMTVGSVPYAAPEQLWGNQIDGKADQYGLACTVFQLLTGQQAFTANNPVELIGKHLNAPPPRISALRPDYAALDKILATALAKDPKSRFPSCTAFAGALAQALDSIRHQRAATMPARPPAPSMPGQSRPHLSTPRTPAPPQPTASFPPRPVAARPAAGSGSSSASSHRLWLIGAAAAAALILAGAVVLAIVKPGRQSSGPPPTSATPTATTGSPATDTSAKTPPPGRVRIYVDGQIQQANKQISCLALDDWLMVSLDDVTKFTAELATSSNPPKLNNFAMTLSDGSSFVVLRTDRTRPQVRVDRSTYTIYGNVEGRTRVGKEITKNIEISFTCR
jgi:serine/threonine-protein kinase